MIPNFASIKVYFAKRGYAEAVLIYGPNGWRATAFFKKEPDVYQLGRGQENLTPEEAEKKIKELADEWRKKQKG